MKRKIKDFGLIIICMIAIDLMAAPSQLLEQAADAYNQKDYSTAIDLYEQVLNEENYSLELYYNLGNSYFKNNDLGRAILNFERALLLDAGNEDVRHNLAVARYQLTDEISEIPPFFLKSWWFGLRQLTSPGVWGFLGLLLFWLGVGGLVIWQMAKSRDHRKKGFLVGVSLMAFSLLPLLLGHSAQRHLNNSEEGIILAKEVALHQGPDKMSQETMALHEGTKVELLDLIDSMYKVRLANGEEGWLVAGSFEEI